LHACPALPLGDLGGRLRPRGKRRPHNKIYISILKKNCNEERERNKKGPFFCNLERGRKKKKKPNYNTQTISSNNNNNLKIKVFYFSTGNTNSQNP
jgi:hypothetical protein